MAAGEDLTNFKFNVICLLAVISGLVVTVTIVILTKYYQSDLKQRNFLGDHVFMNAFYALGAFYVVSVFHFSLEDASFLSHVWEITKR